MVGLGYVGFPTACIIAAAGHDVIGVDVDHDLVDRLRQGELHIVNEDGLAPIAHEVFSQGRLRVTTVPEPADVFIISVPTPLVEHQARIRQESELMPGPFRADLSYVRAATLSLASVVRSGNLIILESTVPPGTTVGVVRRDLEEAGADTSQLLFVHAPERVLPGNILNELVYNDRIVGGLTPEAGDAAAAFYRTFVKGEVVVTDVTTAEIVKLMENTFRDVNIALANEFAMVCERLGVDIWEAIRLANRHPRVKFLRPGPGVGGHCIAVDPYFVVQTAPDLTPLIQAARQVNRHMPLHVVELFRELTQGLLPRKVAILGVSYKANVGDTRESPALEVAQLLEKSGYRVEIHDPYVASYNLPLSSVAAGADALVVLTDHDVYATLDPLEIGSYMARRLALDARGILDVPRWQGAGFRLVRLGDRSTYDTSHPYPGSR